MPISASAAADSSATYPTLPFNAFTATWLSEHQIEWRRSHLKVLKCTLDGHLLPHFCERSVGVISKADIMASRPKLADPAVREVRMGPLVTDQDDLSLEVNGLVWVEAGQLDPLVDAARTLYQAGRLSGADFLRALGGYVYRADEQMGVPA